MALNAKELKQDGYEMVVEFSDDTGFLCFISVHNIALGHALGGCRIKPYATRRDALDDVLRLSKGMTYKSSLAGLNFGGGKCTVLAETATREIMLKVGEAVNYFQGLYITAEDVGTTLADIEIAAEVTDHTVHMDGSSMTARGVLACMQSALVAKREWGNDLVGVPIWIEGLGKVGMDLAYRLKQLESDVEMNMFVSDIRREVVERAWTELQFREITEGDKKFIAIYSPCAMGQVIHADNVNKINYSIICGSANNQLVHDEYADLLRQRDILYIPDYLANAGGVICAAGEFENWTEQEIGKKCDELGEKLIQILNLADSENITPLTAANFLAEERFLKPAF